MVQWWVLSHLIPENHVQQFGLNWTSSHHQHPTLECTLKGHLYEPTCYNSCKHMKKIQCRVSSLLIPNCSIQTSYLPCFANICSSFCVKSCGISTHHINKTTRAKSSTPDPLLSSLSLSTLTFKSQASCFPPVLHLTMQIEF
jgi:hypothetical protein